MEDGSITDNMITVSSTYAVNRKAWGRLNRPEGSWTPITDDKKQWFQVNFDPNVKQITHIATQGNGQRFWWVEEYYVMFKREGASTLETYMENNQRIVGLASSLLRSVWGKRTKLVGEKRVRSYLPLFSLPTVVSRFFCPLYQSLV